MPETVTQPTLAAIPAGWLPLQVIDNPAKQSSGDPAFLACSSDGWPVALFWSRTTAEKFVDLVNYATDREAATH